MIPFFNRIRRRAGDVRKLYRERRRHRERKQPDKGPAGPRLVRGLGKLRPRLPLTTGEVVKIVVIILIMVALWIFVLRQSSSLEA